MNDQIDSSIPVLTEVIAPTTPTTLTSADSQSTTSTPTPVQSKPVATVGSTPDIKNLSPQLSSIANTKVDAAPKPLPAANANITPKPAIAPAIQAKIIEEPKQEQIVSQDADADEMNAEAWQQMEHKLKENVLRQVLARVDFVLEHRVRDSLAEVLQTAVDQLADDIRAGLRQSLEDVITRAVTQELSKLKSHKH